MHEPSTGEQRDINEAKEAQFGAYGHRVDKHTLTYQRGPEPAMRETVDAQIEAIRQHTEDFVKLAKAELTGQIDLLRKDINDLRDRKRQQQQHTWDLRKLMINGLIYAGVAGLGALIMWALTRGGA